MAPRHSPLACLALSAVGAAACAGGPAPPTLPLPTLPSTAGLVEMVKLEAPVLVLEPPVLQATSAEIYSRIARGARLCWLGPAGRLRESHIFHADVASSRDGGAVEIFIHERAVDQPKPWGYKAFRIRLTEQPRLDGEGGASTTIAVENLRMPETSVPDMRAEVFRWAGGGTDCAPQADAAPNGTAPPTTAKATVGAASPHRNKTAPRMTRRAPAAPQP